jgi:hypothetical protein
MLNYNSYNLSIGAFTASGGQLATPIRLSWYADAAGTQLVFQETGWIWTPTTGNVVNAMIAGPLHTRYMKIIIFELSGVNSPTANFQLYGNSRSLTKSSWFQAAPQNGLVSAGVTNGIASGPKSAFSNGADGVICSQINAAFGVAGVYWYPLSMCSTQISARFNTTQALGNDFALCSAAGLLGGGISAGSGSSGCVWNAPNVAGQENVINLNIPRAPLYYVINYSNLSTLYSIVANGVV